MAFHRKVDAEKAAKDLKKKLKGRGWKIDVWENLGWHYRVSAGSLKVYPSYTKGHYFCLFGKGGGGDSIWTDSFTSRDPNEVVEHQLAYANEVIEDYNSLIEEARNIFGFLYK